MILIDDHRPNLNTLAKEHFEFLNPTVAGGDFSHHSLIKRIERAKAISSGKSKKVEVDFWRYLLHNSCKKVYQIIVGRPSILKSIIKEIDTKFGSHIFCKSTNYDNAELTDFGNDVAEVFNYSSLYRKKQKCSENCQSFRLLYCPYCNENLVTVIEITDLTSGNDLLKALSQLDHFFPQVRYPYLSLSFFNLIPTCFPCNSQFKKEKDFDISTHFNPFHKRLDDFISFSITDEFVGRWQDVRIDATNKIAHPMKSLQDFQIIARYNTEVHKRRIFDLLTTLKNHTPKIRNSVSIQLGDPLDVNVSKGLLLTANGVPSRQNEINTYQIGKLKRDICIQLNLI